MVEVVFVFVSCLQEFFFFVLKICLQECSYYFYILISIGVDHNSNFMEIYFH